MRSYARAFFLAVCVISLVACLLPAPSSAADVIRLKYANFSPPTHGLSVLSDQWCKELEKRTNGRVKVAYFPAGTLVSANQTYDGVVKGIVDIG
ncbi:MAG: TRAP-type C4-dicarboxylate transport system, periplasmic component, partial [Deltaproteobacteria bacterium]|nr:TRAP-type C4-dicarboxylate transport system, periplasmic component [Deltaproteobacteria bacterium]